MTAPSAIQGNRGAYLLIDSTEYDTDALQTRLTWADKDESDLTFEEAAAGDTKDGTFVVTFLQALAATTLWRKVFDSPADEYAVVWGPYGNSVPTVSQPHFLFSMKANGKPEVGAQARFSKTRENTEYSWDITTAVTLDDGA